MIEFNRVRDAQLIDAGTRNMVVSAFAVKNVWNLSDKATALPLIELAKLYYSLFIPRVFVKGEAADGGSFGAFTQKQRWTWIESHRPHPPGFELKRGGRALYRSMGDYRRALGMRRPRFVESGRIARSFQIRAMTPRRVRIAPRGGRQGRDPSNQKLLGFVARKWRKSPVKPNASELRQIMQMAAVIYPPQLINQAVRRELGFNARKKLRTRQNALERIRKRMRKAGQLAEAQGSK